MVTELLIGIDTFTTQDFFSARREGYGCGMIINSIKLIDERNNPGPDGFVREQ